jgi:glycine cleavage system regulatory protein
MTVEVPDTIKVRELREAFEGFCDEQDLDGELTPSR